MKIFIPELNDLVSLNKDWSFNLYEESRNLSVINKFFSKDREKREEKVKSDISELVKEYDSFKKYNLLTPEKRKEKGAVSSKIYKISSGIRSIPFRMTIKKGEILEIDRIYIRKGAEDYSSVTFKWIVDGKTLRFWAKLDDVNNLYINEEGKLDRWPEGRLLLVKGSRPGLICDKNKKMFGFILHDGKVEKAGWNYHFYIDSFKCRKSLDELISEAKKENLPEELVNAFIVKHKEFFKE